VVNIDRNKICEWNLHLEGFTKQYDFTTLGGSCWHNEEGWAVWFHERCPVTSTKLGRFVQIEQSFKFMAWIRRPENPIISAGVEVSTMEHVRGYMLNYKETHCETA